MCYFSLVRIFNIFHECFCFSLWFLSGFCEHEYNRIKEMVSADKVSRLLNFTLRINQREIDD